MSRSFLLLRIVVVFLLLVVLAAREDSLVSGQTGSNPKLPAATADWSGQDRAVQKAVAQAVAQRNNTPAFLIYDIRVQSIVYDRTGDQAKVWLEMVDRGTGKILATEPGLALAYRNEGSWQVSFPGDVDFQTRLAALPEELATRSILDNFAVPAGGQGSTTVPPIGGFYLPWKAGLSKWLTQGANHLSCPTTCRYAADWADGTNFPILAAKGGVVFAFRDSCQNDDHTCTNYLVVMDSSTTPVSYHFYFHLANNSIPAALKVVNTPVSLGQWVANADNTGNSTGSHLHFMVVTDTLFDCIPAYCDGDHYWWGTSVDITFKDVFTNWDVATQGGRPCTQDDVNHSLCAEWQETYLSGNPGAFPISGGLVLPADRSMVSNANLAVTGWAVSSLGISQLQLIANYDGNWREVGMAQTTTPFAMTLDVCATGIPNGMFDLALRAWDPNGDQSTQPIGLRHLVKDVACSPPPQIVPVCVPSADQVALFAQPNFGGVCAVLGQGNYPNAASLAPLQEHGVASLQVGQNVKAILYSGTDFSERQETFTAADHNLADNRVNSHQVSSVKVIARATAPAALTLANPIPGPGGNPLTSIDSVVLNWGKADGAAQFQVKILPGVQDCTTSTLTPLMVRDFSPNPTWSIGTLPDSTALPGGGYKLCVKMRADGTADTMWYGRTFVVAPASLPVVTPLSLPYSDDMENQNSGWVASGLWQWASDPVNGSTNHSWIFNNGSDYNGSPPPMGDLTSPPVSLPSSGGIYFRFDYHYHTEASTPAWDQRWLQISKDGGNFVNLMQFSDDQMDSWLHSPVIDLSSYVGSTIRLRFHFDSIDVYYNNFAGWSIDNITINNTPPPAGCNEPTANNSLGSATIIAFGQTISADICPAGDVDYYKIAATQGDVLGVTIHAQTLKSASHLHPQIALFLESDPTSVLAENGDVLSGEQLDPYLVFNVSETGNYYLRVMAQGHPGVGGTNYNYTLVVRHKGNANTDAVEPLVSLTNPTLGSAWRQGLQIITAQASDPGGSGVRSVEFFWHPADWDNATWQSLNTYRDNANGWDAFLDTSTIPEGQSISVAARATDWVGNAAMAVNWNVVIDNTPPQVSFTSQPVSLADTLIPLQWSANDAASGIASFDLEVNTDQGGWQPVDAHLAGSTRQFWFLGAFGHQYSFRLRGVDYANNLSEFTQVDITTLAACTGDSFEPDDLQAKANDLNLLQSQQHNLCGLGDQDWVKFTPQAGQRYQLLAVPDAGSGAQPVLDLYQADGTKLLEVNAAGYGMPASLIWVAPDNNTYYLKVSILNSLVAGSDITYYLWVGSGLKVYLPLIKG